MQDTINKVFFPHCTKLQQGRQSFAVFLYYSSLNLLFTLQFVVYYVGGASVLQCRKTIFLFAVILMIKLASS